MRKYELTYLVSDDVDDSHLTKVTGKIGGLIDSFGGKLEKEELWGRRKLAYPIKKSTFATFVTVSFLIDPIKINSFDKDLRHNQDILRHLLIVREYEQKEMSLTKEDVAESLEITEVVGGEKSKETVSEEEVDNRNLMFKRDLSDEKNIEKAEENTKDEVTKPDLKEKDDKTEKVSIKGKSVKVGKVSSPKSKEEAKNKKNKVKVAKDSKPASPKKSKAEDEAERLTKLDEELDELLKDEI